jgi:hypothetical protein
VDRRRKSLTIAALVAGMMIINVPAASADDGCMPRFDPRYLVGDLTDCAKEVIVPLINWPDLPPHT